MPRPLFDSPYIYGLHDPGGEYIMGEANRRGWIVFTEEVGSDPNNTAGGDYRPWSGQDYGVVCRINNGYGAAGTIPTSNRYEEFARRVANYVAASPGCKIWIIGNEMNFSQEWPALASARGLSPRVTEPAPKPERGPDADPRGRGSSERFSALHASAAQDAEPAPFAPVTPAPPTARSGLSGLEMITPSLYVRCFKLCRDAIKALPGHADDQVLIGAVAPWNDNAKYPGNEIGDWVKYFSDVLAGLGANGLDGITLHTYTHGPDPALIYDTSTMNPPFQDRHYNFLAYRDFMNVIPADMRDLPVYITESNQDDPWLDQNNGWVQGAYGEINWWNRQPGAQQIRALALYRWPPYDKWYIQGKDGVIDGFRAALTSGYQWLPGAPKPFPFQAGDIVKTLTFVNFRATPGGAPLVTLDPGETLVVIDGKPVSQDGLIWWRLRRQIDSADGWAAQATAAGVPLLEKATTPPPAPDKIQPGATVRTTTIVRARRTPGVSNKPPGDVVAELPAGTEATVEAGPQSADAMTWWRLTLKVGGAPVAGWAAESLPNGTVLLEKVTAVTPEPPPDTTFAPGERFKTTTVVRLRQTPGSTNKPADDIVADLPPATNGVIVAGPQAADALTWWRVTTNVGGVPLEGWVAEALPGVGPLIVPAEGVAPTPAASNFRTVLMAANVRRTPGYTNKPGSDVVGFFRPKTVVNVQGDPQQADNLTWRMTGGISPTGAALVGQVAETDPAGQPLLALPPQLPGTQVPDPTRGLYLAPVTDQAFDISQLWGENPDFYSQFKYDGVALLGHNGIDFMTPLRTLLFAVDDGVVARAEFEAGGFGNFVLLRHAWGESIYAHLDANGVTPGQVVGRGQFVGFSGNTGASSGPHLHFAIRINPYDRRDGWGGFSDPLPYLPPQSFRLPRRVLVATDSLRGALAQVAPTLPPSGMGNTPSYQRP